jgi:hypothetical protein
MREVIQINVLNFAGGKGGDFFFCVHLLFGVLG